MSILSIFNLVYLLGARSAQAIVDEALKAVQRSVKDKLNGKGGVSIVFIETFYIW